MNYLVRDIAQNIQNKLQANKVVIILGLIIETLSTIVFTAVAVGVATFDNWFNYSTTMEMPYDDYEQLVYVFNILGTVFIILAIIMIGILILNHILFRKLIKGYLTEKQARNVYLYLAIYGGLYLFSNQILGILYLIGFNDNDFTQNIVYLSVVVMLTPTLRFIPEKL